jgi:Phage protein Gp138 N-terminal domain
MSGQQGYTGWMDPEDTASDLAAHSFLINQIIGRLATSTLVKVLAVTNSGGVSAVGFVDVQPLVNQTDGAGQPTPHGQINNLPYFRLQGGTNAIIIDPQVGDIGLAVFCSRDISSVKATKAQANPASFRRHDWADGIYVGGVLNGVPQNYVAFSSTGIAIVTSNALTIQATNCTLDSSGNLGVKGEVTRGVGGADSVTLGHHDHTGVTAGTGQSGPPVAGT